MPIQQRIASIQRMVEKSVQDPEMRKLAGSLTRHCGDRDGMCEAKAIYKAVKKRVRYVGDIAPIKMSNGDVEGIDLYQSARRTWEMGIGDCDDQTILIETLLSSIGITARSRVTAEEATATMGTSTRSRSCPSSARATRSRSTRRCWAPTSSASRHRRAHHRLRRVGEMIMQKKLEGFVVVSARSASLSCRSAATSTIHTPVDRSSKR